MWQEGLGLYDNREKAIAELFAYFSVSGEPQTQEWYAFIDKLHDKLLMAKDSQTAGNTKANTDISCNLRIRVEANSKMKIENKFYCIKRARVLLKS